MENELIYNTEFNKGVLEQTSYNFHFMNVTMPFIRNKQINKVKKQEENLNLLQYYSLLRKRTAQAHFERLQRVQCDEHFKSMSVYIYKMALVEGNHPHAL